MTPPITLNWVLPTNGDSRQLVGGGHGLGTGSAGTIRPATIEYLTQVAQAAEQVGFSAALTPTGSWCEDAWLTTAMLVARTERLKFLVAFRPGFLSPTLAAQQAATYQRHSGGRLLLNVVTGGEGAEQRRYGDFLDKEARYRLTGEFLQVVRALRRGETVDLDGEHVHVEGAILDRLPDPVPPVCFGGSSANLEIAPNLWAGVGLVRGGAGTALVGSHEEVADRIAEYDALGIDEFVLSGYPHLEEAWRFGEGVMPILRRRGLWVPAAESVAGSARTAAFARLEGSR